MLNQCNFIGRLGESPEIRNTQSGTLVTSFSIACSKKYKNKEGEQVEETEWVRVVAWQRLAEICGEYLSKGSLVFISGEQKTRKWQDQEGNDRYTTEIVAREMKMLSPKLESGQGSQQGQHQGGNQQSGYQQVPPAREKGSNVPF